ncbi:MAG: type I glyceraldehyde-3-phosphate dehydrogenase [Gammaproteobacteria bacterium]|nr:type I glyceraldehyde-3-phosphate dehydrogenase [Gammaproteobacteria bacterium]|tara:strand:+ start:5555 stop:6565 length:1011 start_codon:yes stop_codon:yes gene_type:complete
MTTNIAINGFGRIGRNIFRAYYENNFSDDINIIAINDLGDTKINAHLLKYDTAHGVFEQDISIKNDKITINNKDEIIVLSERDPSKLPWDKLKVDIVLECTGLFTSKEKASKHIEGGAKKVLISAPSKDAEITVVYGVNHNLLNEKHKIISNASCTTNCLATLINNLHNNIGIESGLMTTIHSYTNDQVLTDVYHSDMRRARSATHSMIPTKTGAASAVGLVLPDLKGKLDGFAIRVPTLNVSLVDLCFTPSKKTSIQNINEIILESTQTNLSGILGYTSEPLVSIDFNHTSFSGVYDDTLTRCIDNNLYKICAWYDNEWGFSNRMLDIAKILTKF